MVNFSTISPPSMSQASSNLLKIGDFARLAGTNLRTLRYYEELGLLLPAERSAGGFRYYRDTDVNRLNMIRQLQDLGMQLEDIGELLTSRDAGLSREELVAKVRKVLTHQDRLLAERVAELEEQRERIARALAKTAECAACTTSPTAGNNFCEPCPCTGAPLPKSISALF